MGWGNQPVTTASGKRGRHSSEDSRNTKGDTSRSCGGSKSFLGHCGSSKPENLTEEDMKAHFGKRARDVSPLNDADGPSSSSSSSCTSGTGDLIDVLPNRLTISGVDSGATTSAVQTPGIVGCSKNSLHFESSSSNPDSAVISSSVDSHDPSNKPSTSRITVSSQEKFYDLGDLKIRTSRLRPLTNGAPKAQRGPRVSAARLRTAYPRKMTSPTKKPHKSSSGTHSSGSSSGLSTASTSNASSTSTFSEEDGGYVDIDCEEVDSTEGEADSEESVDDEVSTASTFVSVDMLPVENVSLEIVPAIRPSYFPHVPPYINFCLSTNQRTEPLPREIQKHLKWRLSNITPVVVKKTLTNSGFSLLRKTVEWGGHWGRHMKAALFKTSIKDFQKLNHLPGTFQIGRKDRLWRNIQRFMNKFGKEEFGFMPKTFILPMEIKQLKAAWDSSDTKNQLWIVKPPALARGTGIRVVNKWNQINKKKPIIVQSYIGNPYLINDRKFDLRIYVLVTNFHPLKVYIYNDGLVRFAPVKYSSDTKRASDRFMHLTNYSINKNCELYTQNEDADACEGHKWTLKTLWRHFVKDGKDVTKLWSQIEEIVIKTLICAEEPIVSSTTCYLPNLYNGYELFGFDIILDAEFKPWLLEVNISPSLHSSSPLDLAVKGPMIKELLNIVGYHLPPKLSPLLKSMLSSSLDVTLELETPVFDKRIYVNNSLSKEEQSKHKFYKTKFEKRSEYLEDLIETLTPDDVRQLILAEDELSQCYNFYRIYPTTSTHTYTPYFELPRYYNMLFDAWETKYHDDRSQAVARLVLLCRQKIHLQVPVNAGSMISESQVIEDTTSVSSILSSSDDQQSTASTKNGKETTHEKKEIITTDISADVVSSPSPLQNLTETTLEICQTDEKLNYSSSPTPPASITSVLSPSLPTPAPTVLDNITNNCASRSLGSSCPCHPPSSLDRSNNALNGGKPPNANSSIPSKVADLPKGICF